MTLAPGATLAERLDASPLTALQVRVFVLCALVAVLDGLDTQSIGLVAPLMGPELHLGRPFMGVLFSVSQLGAVAGALVFGPLGDRYGRKTATVACTALIAAFTFLTATTVGREPLLLVRFLAGVGLGGAIPSVLALTSEYAPARLRGGLVAAVFAGYPIGATLGGFVAAALLQHGPWRTVFYVGALAPLAMLALVAGLLPESVRFLAGRGGRGAAPVLAALRLPPDTVVASAEMSGAGRAARGSPWAVFGGGLLAPSACLWTLFFFVFATTKVMVVWLPTMLTQAGFAVSAAAVAQACFNGGAAAGMLGAGRLVDRFGPSRVLLPSLLLATACVPLIGLSARSFGLTAAGSALLGLFVGVGGSGAYAMAARLYPVAVRATGLGWSTAWSRMGQVVSPLAVGVLLGAGTDTGRVYAVLAALPLLAAVAVAYAAVRRTAERAAPAPLPVAETAA